MKAWCPGREQRGIVYRSGMGSGFGRTRRMEGEVLDVIQVVRHGGGGDMG